MILCIVFSTNACLVTWVRPLSEKHLDNMNAQRVWEEFANPYDHLLQGQG